MFSGLLAVAIGMSSADIVQSSTGKISHVEGFAKHSVFTQVKISPAGEFLAATYPFEGHKRLAIIERKSQNIVCNYFFRSDESVMGFWWGNENRVLMTISKQNGQYAKPFWTGELFAGNADCSGKTQLFGARANDMAGANIESLLVDDPKHILISSNPEKRQYNNLYKLNIYNGKKYIVEKAEHENAEIVLDNSDVWRVSSSYEFAREGLAKAEATGRQITYFRDSPEDDWKEFSATSLIRSSAQGSSRTIGFSADNNYLFTLDNVEASTTGIYKTELSTGHKQLMYRSDIVDVTPYMNIYINELGKRVREPVGAIVHDGKPKAVFFDEESNFAQQIRALETAFPEEWLSVTSRTRDDRYWVIKTNSDVNPGKFYLFDSHKNKVTFMAASKPWIDSQKMSHKTPIQFEARDGTVLYGYLTIPYGKEARDLPLIVHPHGGPHGPRDYWFYSDEVQVYASAGYAVLQINFRGSGGYGREFEDSGYGQWGGEMQDDLTDGTLWAISQGIANKDKICISGASYGGYAALMGVVKEPDLYQCAIGYVGVYDLLLMFKKGNVAERLGWGTKYMTQAFGGTEEKMKQHSPAHNAEKIKAGVFIVHGGRDEQAHYENAYVMREALTKVGKPPKWLWKNTEGHGFYDEGNRQELFQEMLLFLGEYLD
ncbi:MAG: prolyl oligopeptidase family serine peptidase [Shewanella sp.]|nr:prolyl oligopeptidase family serine peptidase [Shewanella sp.]MCF1431431.1 prolyl oligopeptidase family serine peptidase [Shewanella sp.]MCF1458665.1 prolyl oligopeptidase family serine peptidase [Shewanella sp.]